MTDIEKLTLRVANAETVIFTLANILYSLQPEAVQDEIDLVMNKYHDACRSLGAEIRPEFGRGDR